MSATVPLTVEQRIVEAWAGLPMSTVTGWAALRLYGGGFFDGLAADGRRQLDVPLLIPHSHRPSTGTGRQVVRVRAPFDTYERFGIPATSPERSVIEAVRWAASLRDGVVAIDMAVAARITTVAQVLRHLASLSPLKGGPKVRQALGLADAHCRSPQESRLRLIWMIDAGFPPRLMNRGIWDDTGQLIGVPDLFDPVAGVAGEYDRAFHRDRARHRRDVARGEGFRGVGIETFTVVADDRAPVVVARMRAARDRALWLPTHERRWTLEGDGPSD